MPAETRYWAKACEMYTLADYPSIDDASVEFPDEIPIAWAVCGKECGHAEFIVDGSTQICAYCGGSMYHTAVRRYVRAEVA